MNKRLAPVLTVVAMLGVVGGVAATQAFKPAEKPATPQVHLVQPAAETVTPTETATTEATPQPAKTVAPVESTTSAAPKKAATVQRQAVVSEPAPEPSASSEPAPEPTGRSAADAYRKILQDPPTPAPAPSE